MIYAEYPLPGDLLPWGLCVWRFAVQTSDPARFWHVIPPDGTVSISMSCAPDGSRHAGLTGPASRAHVVPAGQGMVAAGIRLQPGAAPALIGTVAADLVGTVQPLPRSQPLDAVADALAQFAQDETRIGAVVMAFADLADRKDGPDPVVAEAARRIMANPANVHIAALAAQLALSPRQLRRRFIAACGLSPKAFAQIHRLRQACMMAVSNPVTRWAQLAIDAGFADQAHFNRAVARTFGINPRELMRYLATIDHRFDSRARSPSAA